MGCFGGQTPKRHIIWSNHYDFVNDIIMAGGFLSETARQSLASTALVARKIHPVTGKKCFTGVRKSLKKSQSFACSNISKDL